MPKAPPPDEGLPEWFSTFADMMTLLMTFFVLLFSMATLDPVKIADMAASMQENKIGPKPRIRIKSQSEIKKELKEAIQQMDMEQFAKVTSSPKGTTITIDSQFAFEIGSADLKTGIFPLLDSIIPIMKDEGNRYPIAVEGHTDNLPTSGSIALRYPSNWELSSARASSVVVYCIAKGVPAGKMRAVGFADQIPYGTTWAQTRIGVKPEDVIKENATVELRFNNRRVEISFLAVG